MVNPEAIHFTGHTGQERENIWMGYSQYMWNYRMAFQCLRWRWRVGSDWLKLQLRVSVGAGDSDRRGHNRCSSRIRVAKTHQLG